MVSCLRKISTRCSAKPFQGTADAPTQACLGSQWFHSLISIANSRSWLRDANVSMTPLRIMISVGVVKLMPEGRCNATDFRGKKFKGTLGILMIGDGKPAAHLRNWAGWPRISL